ncbi:surface-adhesin E family protein [Sphingomonas sp. G-3-2-10]|uniref:surface-adhesin E family protein n=1 Tax=Sphingomonas sp. G-3-2-10 TaxID=2728838 RepID=UPI00146B7F35|nr:surface-adhesin E family protein [Sphingomonas sp. G-3-2-10]NML07384.1 hypothetical protein [Sphingomonas sp. G-3-2-10]
MFALLFATNAPDPRWHYIDGTDRMAMYVEAGTITIEGDTRSVLTLSAYAQPRANGAYNIAVTMGFHCTKKLFRTIEFAALDAEGNILVSEPSPTPEYRVPGEGSYNDQVMRFVCFGEGGTRVDNPLKDAEWRFWD